MTVFSASRRTRAVLKITLAGLSDRSPQTNAGFICPAESAGSSFTSCDSCSDAKFPGRRGAPDSFFIISVCKKITNAIMDMNVQLKNFNQLIAFMSSVQVFLKKVRK
jgi:hypothetical protein